MKRTKTVIDLLYKAYNHVNKAFYSDESWEGVNRVNTALLTVLNSLNLTEDRKFECWLSCEDGGYKTNKDGQIWKEYLVHIEENDNEIISGTITCSPCGTVNDTWSSYDITLILSNVKK